MKKILFLLLSLIPVYIQAQPLTAYISINGTSYSAYPICFGADIDLTGTSSGGTGNLTHLWTSQKGQIYPDNVSITNFIAYSMGQDTVVYTVTDSLGNTAKDTIIITVNPNPKFSQQTPDQSICFGSCINLKYKTPDGNWFDIHNGSNINDPIICSSAVDSVVCTVCPSVNSEYLAVVTNTSSGCFNTRLVKITVIKVNPVVTASPNPVCHFDSTQLSVTQTCSNCVPNYTYSWTSGVSDTAMANPYASPTAATTYTVTVTEGSPLHCKASAGINVTLKPIPPAPVVTGTSPVCPGDTGVYFTNKGKSDYIWTINGGAVIPGGTTVSDSIIVIWGASPVSVCATYTDTSGCKPAAPTCFPVVLKPTISLSPPTGKTLVCPGDTEVYCTAAGNFNYLWTVNGGIIISGQGTNCATVEWGAIPSNVCVNYNNNNTCPSPVPACVNVSLNPVITPVITGADSVCLNDTTLYCTDAGKTNYQWTVNGGNIISGQGTNCISVEWNGVQPFSVIVIYNDPAGCTVPDTMPVAVKPTLVPSISGPDPVCMNSTGNIYCTEAGKQNYIWTISGGTVTSGQNTECITVSWGSSPPFSLSVIYTDQHSCVPNTPTTEQIAIKQPPVINIYGDTAVCLNDNIQYCTDPGKTGYTWTVNGGVIASGSGTSCVTVTWGANPVSICANYTDTNGCTATAPECLTIKIKPPITPVITGKTPLCANDTAIYCTASGKTNYVWTAPGGTINSGLGTNCIKVVWDGVQPFSVSVKYTDSLGCVNTPAVYPVAVYPTVVPTITGANKACFNSAGNIYYTEAGKYNYQWTITGGTITGGPGNDSVTVTWTAAGAQSICVTYDDSVGCVVAAPTCLQVTVNPQLTAEAGNPKKICSGKCTNIGGPGNTTASGGTPSYTYLWSPGGSVIPYPSVCPTTTTKYFVVVTDSEGCTAKDSVVITVNPKPTVNAGPDMDICYGTCDTIGGNPTGASATPPLSYQWNPLQGLNNTTIANPISCTLSNTTYTVTVTDGNGCSASDNMVVTVNPLPVPTISGPAPACFNDTNTYTTQAGMTGYTWIVSSGGVIIGPDNLSSIDIHWTGTGPQTVCVNYFDQNGCTDTILQCITVVVNALPVPTITGTDTVCINNTTSYCTENNKNNYIWTVTGGTINSGQGTNCIDVTWTSAGTQSACVTYTEPSTGCTSVPFCINIKVNPLPVPTLVSGPTSVCVNSTGNVYCTNPNKSNYVWSIPAGGTITAGQGTACATVSWTTAGNQQICVNYTDSNGCTAAQPSCFNITVNPLPVPAISGNLFTCFNDTDSYCTIAGMSNYNWIVTGGTFSGQGTNCISVHWTSTGQQTISLTYTDINGCNPAAPTIDTVMVNPLPVPLIIGPDTSCAYAGIVYSTDPGMSSYIWTVTGGSFTGQGTNSIIVDWTGVSGLQTISVTYTNINGCTSNPSVMTVLINILPQTSISGPMVICQNTPGTVYCTEPGMSNYQWATSSGLVSGTGNCVTVLWTTPGQQQISVSYNDPNGCSTPLPVDSNVVVNPLPVPVISGNFNTCIDQTETFCTVSGMSNYTWTLSDGTFSGQGTNCIIANWTNTGQKIITLTYTDANGCNPAVITTDTIMVNPLPVPVINGTDTTCAYAGTVYSTDTGMNNYFWTVAGVPFTGQGTNSIIVDWTGVSGLHAISVTYTDINGCKPSSATTMNVLVNVIPVTTITGPTDICESTPGAVYCTEPNMFNYLWTTTSGTVTGTGNCVTVLWDTPGQQYISVTYNDANGCSSAVIADSAVMVYPLPVPAISGDTNTCINNQEAYCTASGMINYLWNVTGGTFTGQGTNCISVTWTSSGAQTISLTYTDTNGCNPLTASIYNVLVNPLPVPSITGQNQACANSGIVFSTESGMSDYIWSITNGSITGQDTDSIAVNWVGVSGQVTINVTYTDSNGCSAAAPASLIVTVYPLPVTTISGSAVVCQNDTDMIYCTEANMTGYTWNVTGGIITSDSSLNCVTVLWTTTGQQNINVIYNDLNGCSSSVPFNSIVTVNSLPAPVISGNGSVCVNSVFTYTTDNGMSNYNWTVSPGNMATINGESITVLWSQVGLQTLSVNYVNINGCPAANSAIYNVMVNPLPVPSIISGPVEVCYYDTVTYCTELNMQDYTWNVTGGKITYGDSTDCIIVNWNLAGDQLISINYTDDNGCKALSPADSVVTVNALPAIVFSETNIVSSCIACDGILSVINDNGPGIASYLWSNGESSSSITNLCPGAYQVTVTSESGCVISKASSILSNKYIEPLKFYNTFSPNGDAINDQWTVKDIQYYPDNELKIIDRWGTEVYSKKGYDNLWTGSDLPEGTYFYHLRIVMCSEERIYTGYVTIIR